MAVTPDTVIRLVKSNLDLDENNQINFASATDQFNYFNSLPKLITTNASYQRKDNYIRYPAHIDSIIEYNYCMYKNTHYTDRWFYAYITKMEYENDNCTRIYIKTDVFQTWQFDLIYKRSFVEREHVNSDTVGEHTVPEDLETGDYIINAVDSILADSGYYTVISTAPLHDVPGGFYRPSTTVYNDVFSGNDYYTFSSSANAYKFIKMVDAIAQNDSINSVFMIPSTLYNNLTKSQQSYPGGTSGGITIEAFDYFVVTGTTIINLVNQQAVTMQTTLNGYTPKNNKLKCYPYNFLEVTNNSGSSVIYKYEQFVSNSPKFNVDGAITPGCSIHLYPVNYNKINDITLNQTGIKYGWNDGINAGKYPIGSWNCDAYTNWLTQNGINIETSAITTGINAGLSIASGNPVAIVGGIANIAKAVGEIRSHELSPNQSKGNINSGDCTYAHRNLLFQVNKKSIRSEYARIIDNFFSMYGYKVNTLKVPNITGRTNWNYVKLINPNIEGYIPQEDLQEIKRMFSNGITIWHKTAYFLDYSQSNNIA